MNNKLKQNQAKGKILWSAGYILAVLIAGAFVTSWTIHRADKLMREGFLQSARLVAQAIGSDRIKKLTGTEADLASPEYLLFKDQLIAAKTAYPECRTLYLMGRRDNGKVFIYVDSRPAGSNDESPAGRVYEEISPEYLTAFETKSERTVGPVTDRRGTWVTSLIPIKNNATGELIAFLGMEIDGKDWKWEAAHEGFVPVLVTLILVVIISAGSAMMIWRGRFITRNLRALYYIEAGMAASIGVTITLFSVWIANNYEIRNNKEIFYNISNTKTIGVSSVLETLQDVELEGLSTIFSLRQHVTQETFHDFTRYLEKDPAIRGLAWVPVVPPESKTSLEHYGREEISSDYEIWELDSSGNRIPTKERPFYYPIYFESFVDNEPIPGFDLGSEPIKAKTLEEARCTGHILCTDPISLKGESGQQDEIMVFRPVFEKDVPEFLLGFATAMLKMGTLLKTAAASGFDNIPLSMDLYLLQKSEPAIRLSSITVGEDNLKKNESFSIIRPIFIFGRTFSVAARPGAVFEALHPARYSWVTGLAGLIMTAAIVLVIGFIAHRGEKLELLVLDRTRALHESESLQRLLMERISAGVMIIDAQTQVIEAINPFAARLIGAQEEQILGHRCCAFICPNPEGSCPVVDMGQEVNNLDTIIIQSNGNRSPILKSIKRIRIHDKEKLLETFVDITDLKLAEESLRKSYAIQKGVLESPKDVVIFALDHQYRYIAFNKNHQQTMKRIWGVDITLGTSMLEYIKTPEDNKKAKINFDRALSGESFTIIEEYGDTALERRYYEDIYNPITDDNGDIIGLTLFLTDITERKQAEEQREKLQVQLSQAQKMESIGRLAGGVAHDFNNMLGVIIGYSELAMRETAANDPLHIKLKEIRKAAARSADLTRQLLAFARKQTVSPRLVDMNEIVANIVKMLVRLIGEDIDLTWLPDPSKLPVNIDPSQIDQILTNLCVNARDAISGVGSIIIETHKVIFDKSYCSIHPEFIAGEYVMLCVSDNGYGMKKETVDNIFEPFFTTKESSKGTGLGLATVYGIVKQNNGFINVYSEPGKGTTFKVYLPQCAEKTASIQKENPTAPDTLGHETVLLVEDEPAILDIGKLMLERLGYQVLTATTPVEAINLAKEHVGEISLLITDVVMPEMNGRDLAKKLLSFYPGIKRLFMSGYTGDVIAHHGMLDKGVHFIHKPFSIEDLAIKVREALKTWGSDLHS